MDAEKAFCGMTFRNKINFRIPGRRQKKEAVEPSAAMQRNFLSDAVDGMEDAERLNSLKSSSIASGLSFAFCWLRAEAEGASADMLKKSSISQQVLDEPWETRYDMRMEGESLRLRDISLLGLLTKEEMCEETFSRAAAQSGLLVKPY